jgi:ergothioneine biosynthesis protein EgtB
MRSIAYIKEKYLQVRRLSESLCENLEKEDYIPQPIEDVSPPKWHLAHTTWFFEVFILMKYKKNYRVYNPTYHFLFNSYYESFGERIIRAKRGNLSRPTVEEVYLYRKYVDEEIFEFLDSQIEIHKELQLLFEIGLNHEQQHQELFIYDIKYIFGTNPLFPKLVSKMEYNVVPMQKAEFINVIGGVAEIGNDGMTFCFDNEMPRHKTFIPDFRIMNRLITNGEYLEFLESGGYNNFELWLSDGWAWKNTNQENKPLYWHKIENEWYEYNLYGLENLEFDKPVSHISYFEAEAFATWKGKRLPTETEWEVAATRNFSSEEDYNLLNNGVFSTRVAENSTQFIGDAWEWTSSSYLPYPGYRKDKGALGEYNGKFMIDQMVLKGGSYATPADHIRITYRNFFQTQKRWPVTGIRLAEDC